MPRKETPSTSRPPTDPATAMLAVFKHVMSRVIPAAFLILFNPFSMKSNSDLRDADMVNLVYAPSYGTPVKDGTINKGQDAIVVALFDQAYLDDNKTTWPVAPAVYRGLLRRLVGAGAIGIYIDIRFQGGNEQRDQELVELFKTARDLEEREHRAGRNTRIVFGGNLENPVPLYAQIVHGQHADEENARFGPHTALLEMPGSRQFYSLSEKFQQLEGGGYRHLESADHVTGNDEAIRINTAAYAMYEVWCEHQPQCVLSSVPADDSMSLQWGYAPDVEMAKYYATYSGVECQPFGTNWYSRLQNTFMFLWGRAFRQDAQGEHNAACLYHRNVSVELINQMAAADLQEFVANKIVFIGGDVPSSPDETFSPVQLYVPGVFRHAMALDNLIEASGKPWLWADRNWLKVMEISVLIVVAYSHGWLLQRLQSVASEGKRMRLHALYEVTLLKALLLVCGISIAIWHLGPNSWFSYLVMFVSTAELWFARWVYRAIREFWSTRFPPGSTGKHQSMLREGVNHLFSVLSMVVTVVVVTLSSLGYLLLAVDGRGLFFATSAVLVTGICVSWCMFRRSTAPTPGASLAWNRWTMWGEQGIAGCHKPYSRFRAKVRPAKGEANWCD